MADETLKHELRLISESDVFKRMETQEHHYNTTLKLHVLSVMRACIGIASVLKKLGIKVHEDELIIAALCHDLGMVDRHDKSVYATGPILATTHGKQSIYYARAILKRELTKRERDTIKNHMFPMLPPPKYREGWILVFADKYCTVKDFVKNLVARG